MKKQEGKRKKEREREKNVNNKKYKNKNPEDAERCLNTYKGQNKEVSGHTTVRPPCFVVY